MGQDHEALGIPFTRDVRFMHLPNLISHSIACGGGLYMPCHLGLGLISVHGEVCISHGASKTSHPEIITQPQATVAGGALAELDLCRSVWLDLGLSDGL
jgi:hypothetical protein